MSELNIFGLREYSHKDLFECTTDEIREADRFYIMHEADKVIAELRNEIEEEKRLRNMALASVPNVLKVMKIIQHHKYKRCVAMAKLCEERDERLNQTFRHGMPDWIAEKQFIKKWHKRWLELAEKFKDKEAK